MTRGIIPPFSSGSDRRYRFLRVFGQYHACRGGTIVLQVEGGVPPYTWEVTGDIFTLDAAETDEQYNFVTVAEDADIDKQETVTVTDDVGTAVTMVVCTCNPSDCCEDADYEFTFGDTPDTPPEPSRAVKFSVTGGCPRYIWEIFGTIPDGRDEYYQFVKKYTNENTNTLFALDGADATAVAIKVTDDCGEIYYKVT
jgi:hypothetical protein